MSRCSGCGAEVWDYGDSADVYTYTEYGDPLQMTSYAADGSNATGAVTRQQFVTMLWRWAKAQGMDVSVGENTNILSYEDAFGISEYAIPAVQWACGAGVMGGYADGTLRTHNTATRAQVAQMFMNFLRK